MVKSTIHIPNNKPHYIFLQKQTLFQQAPFYSFYIITYIFVKTQTFQPNNKTCKKNLILTKHMIQLPSKIDAKTTHQGFNLLKLAEPKNKNSI